jgi:translation initiation factor 1 (eIF-1/SUI1)
MEYQKTYFLVWTKFSKTVKYSVPDKHFSIQYASALLISISMRVSSKEVCTVKGLQKGPTDIKKEAYIV